MKKVNKANTFARELTIDQDWFDFFIVADAHLIVWHAVLEKKEAQMIRSQARAIYTMYENNKIKPIFLTDSMKRYAIFIVFKIIAAQSQFGREVAKDLKTHLFKVI